MHMYVLAHNTVPVLTITQGSHKELTVMNDANLHSHREKVNVAKCAYTTLSTRSKLT